MMRWDLIKAANINHWHSAPSEISLTRQSEQLGRAGILSGLSGLHREGRGVSTGMQSARIILSLPFGSRVTCILKGCWWRGAPRQAPRLHFWLLSFRHSKSAFRDGVSQPPPFLQSRKCARTFPPFRSRLLNKCAFLSARKREPLAAGLFWIHLHVNCEALDAEQENLDFLEAWHTLHI